MALELREAVQRATEILEELYPNQELRHVLLEEVQRSGPANMNWDITLGFTRPGTVVLGAPSRNNRVYKRIRLDAETGRFEGMTDRELEEVGRS